MEGKEGKHLDWPGSYELSLGQPILHFSVNQMLDEKFSEVARQVLEHWVNIENETYPGLWRPPRSERDAGLDSRSL